MPLNKELIDYMNATRYFTANKRKGEQYVSDLARNSEVGYCELMNAITYGALGSCRSISELLSNKQMLDVISANENAVKMLFLNDAIKQSIDKYPNLITSLTQGKGFENNLLNNIRGSYTVLDMNPKLTTAAISSERLIRIMTNDDNMFSTLINSDKLCRTMFSDAAALNSISKLEKSKTVIMKMANIHDYYEMIYNTLHNSSSSLFTKVEQYYDVYYSINSQYYGCHTSDGTKNIPIGECVDNISVGTSHISDINPVKCISLVRNLSYVSTYRNPTLWSLQTKTKLGDVKITNRVCFGGFATTSDGNSANYGGKSVRYASYIPV